MKSSLVRASAALIFPALAPGSPTSSRCTAPFARASSAKRGSRVSSSRYVVCGQRGKRADEHLVRLARRRGGEDRNGEPVRRRARRRLLDVEDVVPADEHPEDAVPDRGGEEDEEQAVADVLRAEPPPREKRDALQAEEDQQTEDHAGRGRHRRGAAMAEELIVRPHHKRPLRPKWIASAR